MRTSLSELLEEKGVITQEEWEQRIQKNPRFETRSKDFDSLELLLIIAGIFLLLFTFDDLVGVSEL